MADQILLYDTAVKSWIDTNFTSLISGKIGHVIIGTPDRAFAQFASGISTDPDGRPPLPVIALTIEEPEVDPERFNHSRINKVGYNSTDNTKLRSVGYPVPVNFSYTLNFWTQYKREMNVFVQKVLELFASQITYILVNIDSIDPNLIYGSKQIGRAHV